MNVRIRVRTPLSSHNVTRGGVSHVRQRQRVQLSISPMNAATPRNETRVLQGAGESRVWIELVAERLTGDCVDGQPMYGGVMIVGNSSCLPEMDYERDFPGSPRRRVLKIANSAYHFLLERTPKRIGIVHFGLETEE